VGFLAPWFLAGLAAVTLPVWLHLLRRHDSPPVPFSSLMFFERRAQSSIKHRRLRYLLLFALRAALVAMVALAFARPFLESGTAAGGGGAKLAILAVDHSLSMRQGDRLERARREALTTAARLGAGTRGQAIAFAASARLLTQPTQDAAELRAAIQSIGPADSRSSYGELARVVRTIADSAGRPLEVHLFSDLQKSSLPPAFADLRLPAGARLILHPVAGSPPPNWTVESVHAPRRLYDATKARVQATIAGFGTEGDRKRVSLALNGRVLETRDVEVPNGGRATVGFLSLEAPHGWSRGEVRIDSGDAFPADDRRLFSVERADASPILFVHEGRERRALLYFKAALEASAESAFRLEDATVEQAGAAPPSKYAFVVLSDVGSLPEPFASALRKYAEAGGSVWIALGPATAASRQTPLLSLPVAEERPGERGRFQVAAYLDPAHPSIRQAGQWEGVKFYQALRVDSDGARVAARLADETPVLLEKKLGEGRVLLFASTFDNISNDFPLHAAFVPFVEQTAVYLGGLGESLRDYPVDSYLPLRSARERGTAIEVIDPEGRRALPLEEAATAQTLALTQAGYYEVRRANGRHETIAVNPDPRESDLEMIPSETLALWQNTGQAASEGTRDAGGARSQQGLWWYALVIALGLALAESWVGNRHLSADRRQDEPA